MDKQPTSVFVRNLDYSTTDHDLIAHFETHGPVKEAFVVRDRKTKQSRGFGFVAFVTHDDAKRAAAATATLANRKVTVDLARKKSDIALASNKPPPKLKKPPSASTPPAAAGGLPAAALPNAAAASPDAAASAPVAPSGAASTAPRPRPAHKPQPPKSTGSKVARHRVIVRNLSFASDVAALRSAFEPHVDVLDVHLPTRADGKHPGFAFVEVATEAACKSAIEAVNATKILGRVVAVDVALNRARYERHSSSRPAEAKAAGVGADTPNEPRGGKGRAPAAAASDDDGEGRSSPATSASDSSSASSDSKGSEDEEGSATSDEEGSSTEGEGSASAADDDESDSESSESSDGAGAMEKTIFVRSLPVEAGEAQLTERFSRFGALRYCRIVRDAVTGISRGTAFVRFEEAKTVLAVLSLAGAGGGIQMLGHPLEVSSAVDREQSARLRNGQRVEKVSKEDTRHLKLARLGLVLSGDPGADSLTPLELRRRDEAWTTKKEKLASSNFSVSETRLSVRNLPTFASESQLREHALSAAASVGGANTAPPVRFTKGKPGYRKKERIVKHVKIVRDDERVGANGEGRSRGFGFVEFETHELARAALKAMSDKPMANLGERAANRRLLVEFAVDSVLKLKLHEERRRKGAEQREAEGDAKSEGAAARRGPVPDRPMLRTKRRAAEDEVALPAASYSGNAKHGPGTVGRPQKRMRPQKPVGPARGGGDKDLANAFEDGLDDMRHVGGKSRRRALTAGNQEDARFDQLVDEYKRKIGATSMQKNISAWM